MSDNDPQPRRSTQASRRLVTVAKILGLTIVSVFAVYVSTLVFTNAADFITISYGVLFALPYCIGAIAFYFVDPSGNRSTGTRILISICIVLAVLLIGGLLLREGWICMIMLVPLWVLSAFFGAMTIGLFQTGADDQSTLNVSLLAALPFAVLFVDNYIPPATNHFQVTRSVIVQAPVASIWPHLLKMDDIGESEGKWNISQNILDIPRPSAAIVSGSGVGSKRQAKWGKNISFEELITEWEEARALRWTFVFPNDSVQKYTDRHISPEGEYLHIIDGGYRLESLSSSETKLTLYTNYSATTPVNHYSSIWGELILGDIQSNVLRIVKDRSESSFSPP